MLLRYRFSKVSPKVILSLLIEHAIKHHCMEAKGCTHVLRLPWSTRRFWPELLQTLQAAAYTSKATDSLYSSYITPQKHVFPKNRLIQVLRITL